MPHRLRNRLLATKTQRPKLPPRLIRRERLLATMEGARSRVLTVIKAAAGFGKTSLALEWADCLAREDQRVAWVSLDPDDDEPGQFLLYVAAALRSACPEIDEPVLNLMDEIALIRPIDEVRLLINALAEIENEVFLFLDDYHVLKQHAIAECMAYLLRHAPAHLHVIVTTRTEPDLPLARLRAQNELLEIDAGVLRFDVEETRRFVEQELTGGLGRRETAALHEKTEGWPAMLRIVATTSQQSPDDLVSYVRQLSARHRPIRSHLIEMLNGLPQEVVSYLLKTSLLESLCEPLGRAVTGAPDSDRIFEMLTTRLLLLSSLDAEGRWFRCHPLLRDFLRQRLAAEYPETIAELHRRAYGWYAGEQRWTDAIRHAVAVGDTSAALPWIENCAMALLRRGELLALLAWERAFPPELIRPQIKARLAIAWGMSLAMRFDEAMQFAAQIEQDITEINPEAREAIGCECQTIRAVALALSDDVDAALELAEDTLRRRSSGRWTTNVALNVALFGWWKRGDIERCYDPLWIGSPGDEAGRNILATVYRHCLLGLIEYEQLQQPEASRHFKEALRFASHHAGPASAAAAQPATLIAQSLYDQGELDQAEAMLADRLPTINAVCMLECVLRAYTVLARISAYRGQSDRAEDLLEQAHELSASRRWTRLETMVWRERIRLAVIDERLGLADSELARFRRVAERFDDLSQTLRDAVCDDLDLAEALVAIARGDGENASERLRRIGARAHSRRNQRMELESAAAMALCLAGEAMNAAGTAALRSALRLAAPCGRVQVLHDYLVLSRRGLERDLRAIGGETDNLAMAELARHVAIRLDAGGRAPASASTHAGPALPLSPREHSILQLLAMGKTNKDIARELSVTPETVKTHMKRMFGKLNVSTRAQAVSKFLQADPPRFPSGAGPLR